MGKIYRLPPSGPDQDAETHARANTERAQRLFAWADAVLADCGLTKTIAQAKTLEELRKVKLNENDPTMVLAIRDALHPASGQREAHFVGLREGGLKQIIKNRFHEMKKARETQLRGNRGSKRHSPSP